jgi:Fic family protein
MVLTMSLNPPFPPTRAGRTINQPTGYRAFIPAPLPPEPPLAIDGELLRLLSDADRALARLDAISTMLPNPDLFVAMYVRQEAVLSSQIEGTQSTLEDVLAFEANATHNKAPKDVEEVVNYVRAMNHGLRRLPEFPLSLRLLREIHKELMHNVRGSERTPGEFRTSQNWIGAPGSTLMNAAFVPPPPHALMQCLGDFEKFIHEHKSDTPLLIQCGLAHAQFETIHPFLDGNGRVGRLLIALMLCEAKAMTRPLLYLSHYLKAHRAEYYDRLTAIRERGDWEGWLGFFLRGVAEVSEQACATARSIIALREAQRAKFASNANALKLIDSLFEKPIVNVKQCSEVLNVSYVTANALVAKLEKAGVLKEVTSWGRNRVFRFQPYLALFTGDGIAAAPTMSSAAVSPA